MTPLRRVWDGPHPALYSQGTRLPATASLRLASLSAYHTKGLLEAGCDEAGRGCLAGPVVAAAVILPPRLHLPGLDDSKRLRAERREALRRRIEGKALAWAVCHVWPEDIDRLNILQATFMAMHGALDLLCRRPDHVLVDGNRFKPHNAIPHICVVGGDGRYRSIAAASILAKTHRDEVMRELHEDHPQYGWAVNKGYPTPDHLDALQAHGACQHHRHSFKPVAQPTLFAQA